MDCNDLDKWPVTTIREVVLTPSERESPAMGDMECKRNKNVGVELTASDRRILQIIATGTETEEPAGVLAGASFRFTS